MAALESGMKRLGRILIWVALALLGAGALAKIAMDRGESLNAIWFVIAAACCYLVAYRLYSAFLAARLLALDDTRDAFGAPRRRPRFCADKQMGFVWAP